MPLSRLKSMYISDYSFTEKYNNLTHNSKLSSGYNFNFELVSPPKKVCNLLNKLLIIAQKLAFQG